MAGKGCIINLLRPRRARIAALCLCAVLLAAAGSFLLRSLRTPAASFPQPPEGLTQYDVTMKLLPEEREIAITEKITFRNDTGDPLRDVVLRTWLNAYRSEETSPAAAEELFDACYPEGFSPGGLTLFDVTWQGESAAYGFDDAAGTVLRLTVPEIKPGEAGELILRCTGQIPVCAHRTGAAGDIWQLGNAIPQLPLYQDHAWRTDAYTPIGDPFVSPCADFMLHLFLPEGCVPACSAPLEKGKDGGWHGAIRGAREIGLCVSPAYQRAEAKAGDTRILSYARSAEGAGRAAEYARKAVETLSSLYGAYPYPALTVCEADFPFGGMEYSGLAMIGKSNFLEGSRDALELTVAHEAAHQWFYSLVGSDQAAAPWQDEALCEWAALRYVRARYGQSSFETLKYYRVDAPMAENIPGSLTPGSPIDYFGSLQDYASVVYGRGAALLTALDEMLGGRADGFLRAYAGAFAWRFVPRADFERFLNDYAGMDCSPLLLDYLDTAH